MDNYKEKTLEYYEVNLDSFVEGTVNADMKFVYQKFEQELFFGAKILDLGCGSGRDAKFFFEKGYQVKATDGSESLCQYASKLTGLNVECMLFEDMEYDEEFDGVWACASLLHMSKDELPAIISKVKKALKPKGVLFTCFKYGNEEHVKNGRFFSNFTEETVVNLIGKAQGFNVLSTFVTGDVRHDRSDERWINIIAKKI